MQPAAEMTLLQQGEEKMTGNSGGNRNDVLISIYNSSFVYSAIAIGVIASLEICMLTFTFLNAPYFGENIWTYRSFYISLLTVALLYFALCVYVKKDIENQHKLFTVANPLFAAFFFAWACAVTYQDFRLTGTLDPLVFMTFSLIVPLGFYLLPWVYVIIAGITDLVIIYMLFLASGSVGLVINTGIFIIFQLVLGVSIMLLKTQLAERIVHEHKNASVDAMTGCGNRRAYAKEMERIADEAEQQHMSFLAIDINGLKEINDTYGHDAGDKLIIGAAKCIENCFGEKGRVFRVGGDEFVVLTTEDKLEDLLPAYNMSIQTWSRENQLELSTSYGYASSADHPGVGIYELAKIADRKMFQAKALHYREIGKDRRHQPS